MFYEVKLPPAECDLLTSLIGQPLERVATDGWSLDLLVGTSLVSVVPDEIPTPDADHPRGDVDRPMIQLSSLLGSTELAKIVGERLGIVRAVNIVSILAGFSPAVECPPRELTPGVLLPAHRSYGYLYYPPETIEQARSMVSTKAIVDWDVAFELITDECPSLVAYTRLHFMRVSLEGLPTGEDWVEFDMYSRRSMS